MGANFPPHDLPSTQALSRTAWMAMSCKCGLKKIGVPNGIRTRVAGVKGQCPRPLDDGDARATNKFIGSYTSDVYFSSPR